MTAAAATARIKTPATGVLKVSSLTFHYRSKRNALNNINIEFRPKAVTAIIGPSGCGKTTFLRTLNRLSEGIPGTTWTGDITLDGTDLRSINVYDVRKRIGMVFQKPNPFSKTIFENVAYGPRIHGESRRDHLAPIVERSLTQAGLWSEVKDRLSAPAAQLSGGQQQRLCIARALAVKPDVLLLDEPCSALHPSATEAIENLIHDLKGDTTCIIVTHNLQQARRIADDTAFFYDGNLIECGETENLFDRPKQKETKDYVSGRFG